MVVVVGGGGGGIRVAVASARGPLVLRPAHGRVGVRCFSSGAEFVLNVPSMGDSITEGNIVSWAKKAGDWVNVDDVVCVLETDKVSLLLWGPLRLLLTARAAWHGCARV